MALVPTLRPRISRADRQRRLVRLNRLLRVHERIWAKDLKNTFAKVTRRLSADYASSRNATFLDARARLEQELIQVFQRRYLATALVFGDQVVEPVKSAGLGLPSAFIWEDHRIEKKDFLGVFENSVRIWIARFALLKVSTIASTYLRDLEEVIQAAEGEGLGVEATGRRIRQVVGTAYAQWKATRVARTEAHTAANMGMEQAVRSTDMDFDREWLSAEDARTRPSHASADGQLVSADQPFQVGGSSLMFPGDPSGPAKEIINCRCVLAYHPRI